MKKFIFLSLLACGLHSQAQEKPKAKTAANTDEAIVEQDAKKMTKDEKILYFEDLAKKQPKYKVYCETVIANLKKAE